MTAPGGFTVDCGRIWQAITSLSNHLLIAMPQLTDPNFSQTVSLICEHGEKGALGIVLNRPLSMTLSEVFEQMKIEPTDTRAADLPVLRGGPVHQDRGFVLHRPGGEWDSTHRSPIRSRSPPRATCSRRWPTGTGPGEGLHRAGLRGLGSRPARKEMLDNSWLSVPADESVIFDLPYEERWLARSGCSASKPGSSPRSPVMPDRGPEIILALDFGLKRIGIASGDTLTRAAHPRGTIANGPAGPDWRALERVLDGPAPGAHRRGRAL